MLLPCQKPQAQFFLLHCSDCREQSEIGFRKEERTGEDMVLVTLKIYTPQPDLIICTLLIRKSMDGECLQHGL